jgi:DNA-binding HxlR family transcriptional regulator
MTPVRRANPVSDCPLTAALAALGGKWKLIVIYWLAESPRHFAGLKREMSGVSQKVLTQQLRELIADEIVHREPTGRVPSPVIYSLTDYGCSLLPMVEQIRRWGRTHLDRVQGVGLGALPEAPPNGRQALIAQARSAKPARVATN